MEKITSSSSEKKMFWFVFWSITMI
jgi:hypothetical protein